MRSYSVFVAVVAVVALAQSCYAAALYEAEDAEHWDNGMRDGDDADAAMAVCPFHPACWQAMRPATMAALLRRNTRAYSYGHVDDRFSKKSKFGNGIRLTK